MKTVLAVLVIVDLGCFAWMQTLPAPTVLSEAALNQEADNVVALSMQVEVGRGYARMARKHRLANRIASALLLANAAAGIVCVGIVWTKDEGSRDAGTNDEAGGEEAKPGFRDEPKLL